MVNDAHTNTTMMLGTYTLDGKVPVEPEIVLSNCHDTAMLEQLVGMFAGDPDIRFFLINGIEENALDMGADFHFIKDSGNWVLANENTLHEVLFDDASFNPTGSEAAFSLVQMHDGSYSISTDAMPHEFTDLPASEQLLVDTTEDSLFVDGYAAHPDVVSDSFFIDPSVLTEGQNEIVVSNFTFGSDHLELPEGLSVKDILVNNAHDFTEVILSQADHMSDDIVVKLLGVSQPDMPLHDYGIEPDNTADDLINHLIHAGRNGD